MKKRYFPFYPLVFAAFPTLTLMAYNTLQIRFTVIFRPLVISLLFGILLFTLVYVLFKKNKPKAALITGVTIILIFSYGHLYNLVKSVSFLNTMLGRHRYLLGIYGLIWISVLILSLKKNIKSDFTKLMNIISIILIALPLLKIGSYYANEAIAYWKLDPSQRTDADMVAELEYTPDVYYIILDSYSRPDVLLENYGLDMTSFIEEMEELGFYYASESHSNYNETFSSLSTSLNLEFITDILEERDIESNSAAHRDLVIHNKVRSFFESLDYEIVAFSTGYKWSEMDDADIYYEVPQSTIFYDVTPFESLLVKNLIIYPFMEYFPDFLNLDFKQQVDSTHEEHIIIQRNVLEKLPEITENKNPTFTFAHILIPHLPYVFDVDGSILEDPGYNSGEGGYAINESYELDGYEKAVKFISQQILNISQQILENSESKPIIIIQSDHGWKDDHRYKILNLYYFPDGDYESLYPAISPVNSFRIVLSKYFSLDYKLLEDRIYE